VHSACVIKDGKRRKDANLPGAAARWRRRRWWRLVSSGRQTLLPLLCSFFYVLFFAFFLCWIPLLCLFCASSPCSFVLSVFLCIRLFGGGGGWRNRRRGWRSCIGWPMPLTVFVSPVFSLSAPLVPFFSSPPLASIKPENGLSSSVRASRSWGTNAPVSLRRNRGRKFALLCLVRFPVLFLFSSLFFFSSFFSRVTFRSLTFIAREQCRFFQPLIAGVMVAVGIRWRRWTAHPHRRRHFGVNGYLHLGLLSFTSL